MADEARSGARSHWAALRRATHATRAFRDVLTPSWLSELSVSIKGAVTTTLERFSDLGGSEAKCRVTHGVLHYRAPSFRSR